jgi:hypothetical protein
MPATFSGNLQFLQIMKEVLVLSLIKCRMLLVLLMGFMVMLLLSMPALRQLGQLMSQSRRFSKISKEISTLASILTMLPTHSCQQGLLPGLLNTSVFSQIMQPAFVSDA